MLHIDPELYNPKVDNKPLMSGNRINPVIGIAGEDIIEGTGIEIERLDNGKIKISTIEDEYDESESSFGSTDYFSKAIEFDLFSVMPTKANVYHFTINTGIDYLSYERNGFSRDYLLFERDCGISSSMFTYDENGDPISVPEVNTLQQPIVSHELKDSSYSDGVGIIFSMTSSVSLPLYLIQISTNGSFTNIIDEIYTPSGNKFLSLSEYENGIYYYRTRVIDMSNGEQSSFVANYFNFNSGA